MRMLVGALKRGTGAELDFYTLFLVFIRVCFPMLCPFFQEYHIPGTAAVVQDGEHH